MVFVASWLSVGAVLGIVRMQRRGIRIGDPPESIILSTVFLWAIAWPLFLPLLIWGKR